MWRYGAVCSALALMGCGGLVWRPPAQAAQAEPVSKLEVRFTEQPFAVDVSAVVSQEPERPVAHCDGTCRLELPAQRYRLSTRGDAPSAERVIDLRQHTRVVVKKGDSFYRGLGIGLEVAGGVGTLVLGAAVVGHAGRTDYVASGASPSHADRNVMIVGLGGLAALAVGLVMHQSARTKIYTEEVDEPAPLVEQAKAPAFSF